MMWKNLNSVYFIGVGGIGMSALARFFRTRGKFVGGYDRTSTSLTDQLMREKIAIHFMDDPSLIPEEFLDPDLTLVIYTPAIPEDNKELAYFKNHGYRIIKRSQALGEVFNASYGIAVAGTHGKTTVSTMVAHLLSESTKGCSAFLGGISKNFNSNLVMHPSSKLMIAEADEYDRSFLSMYPELAIVTAIDDDHMDIYHSRENLLESFESFIGQVKDKGTLIIKSGLEVKLPGNLDIITYSLDDTGADYYVKKREVIDGYYQFTVKTPSYLLETMLGVPGLLNVENVLAAIAVADLAGVPQEQIAASCRSFKGVKRRFDVQFQSKSKVYIDDYAHHPEELRAFISSVRELYPGKKISGIFQPHLYSRTRDFAEGFASSLSLLDELILLDIYPAREQAIEGVSSDLIFKDVTIPEKVMITQDLLMNVLNERDPEVLLTMGAGDIDRLVDPLKSWMESR